MSRKVEYPTVQIPIDGGLWDVPSEPVQKAGGSSNFTITRIHRPNGNAFVLAPSIGAILFGLLFVGFGTVILSLFGRGFLNGDIAAGMPKEFWSTVWAIAGIAFGHLLGIMAIVMSLNLMTQTTRFDRSTGRMEQSAFFRTQFEISLADIVAVQCLYAARITGKGGPYDILQLNLVIATGTESRICLTTSPDERWTREAAIELAQFLGVHLVDQIAQTKAIYEANQFRWLKW